MLPARLGATALRAGEMRFAREKTLCAAGSSSVVLLSALFQARGRAQALPDHGTTPKSWQDQITIVLEAQTPRQTGEPGRQAF